MKTAEQKLRDLKGRGISAAMVAEEMGVSAVAISRLRRNLPVFSPVKIAEFDAIYARHMATSPGWNIEGDDRDSEIARRALAGEAFPAIGLSYGLSRERVRQIASARLR